MSRRRLSGPQLAYVAGCALPTLVLVVLCRMATLQIAVPDDPAWRQLLLGSADLALWLATLALGTVLLAGRRWRLALVLLVIWHTVWNFLAVAGVGVLWATTAHLDATMLGLFLRSPALVAVMATSATPPWLLASLVAVLLVPTVITLLALLVVRRRPRQTPVPRRPLALIGVVLLVAAFVLPVGVPERQAGVSVPAAVATSAVRHAVEAVRGPGRGALVGPASVESDGPARDVLVVLLESTGRQSTTLGDPALETTPTLAALAGTGVDVTRMDAVIPHTSQATTAVLCGTWPKPDVDNAAAGPRGPSRVCLPKLLREQGYATGWFQSAYMFFENDASMFRNLGFTKVVSREELAKRGYDEVNYFGLEDDAALPPMEKWLRSVPPTQHVVLGTTTVAPHHDYGIPDSWVGDWDPANPVRNRYLSALHYSDAYLAKVLDVMKASGRLDDTVVVVVGDHGEAFGEHGMEFHTGVPYDESLHVPAVIAAPGLAPSRIEVPASQVDLLPTIVRLAGYRLRGTSYPGVDLLSAAGQQHRRQFYDCGYHEVCAGVRDWPWKLVDWFGTRPAELYDVQADPGERTDVAAQHPDVVEELQRALRRWQEETKKPYE